jgi:hypothetical protein
MDAAPISFPPKNRSHWLGYLGAWLLLTVYFLTPAREAFDQSLDKSNYATYTHFAAEQAQWGQDVIPMTGPYGFILYGHTYSGELFGVRLLGDLLLKAAFAALLLHLFRRAAPGPLRWIWLMGVVLMVPTVDDLFHDFAILLATLVLLVNLGPKLNRWSWLATLALGALALFKGTHLLTTGLCFCAVLLLGILERRWRAIAVLTAWYAGSVLGFWLLAGQNPLHLPAYLKGVLELSSGYNATMGLAELPFIRLSGLALAGGLTLVFLWVACSVPRKSRLLVTLLLLAGFSFIKWKHGYLRADGHVFIFFTSVSVITLTLCLAAFTPLLGAVPVPLAPWRRRIGLVLVSAVTGFAVLGASEFWLWRVLAVGLDAPTRLQNNVEFLARPGVFRTKLDHELEHNRREADLPQIRNEIGAASVDFFGFEEGLLLLNRLNYHPRPMGGGSFNVFTPWLQEKNEAFVRDPRRAPVWQVLKLQTLDDRLPSGDDPLTLRAILDLYSPVLMQRDYLLLKRRTVPVSVAAPVLLETRRVAPGEVITPPATAPGQLLLFTLHTPLSIAGRLRALIYRAPELSARIVSRLYPLGRDFALKPIMLQRPVILSPLLSDNLDVIQLWGDETGDPVRSLELKPAPGFETGAFTVSFYSAPRPAKPENCDINEIITYREYPLYNRAPIELVTQETGIRELNKEPVTIVHAPGSITWELQPGDQQLIFSYGLMPQAYLDGGQTDGVEFNVEVLWPPNDGRILFKRLVKPLTVMADRGMQRARVFLPPYEKGARLRIRTHPGPDNDGAYDQSYVTRVQIKRGTVMSDQVKSLGVSSNDSHPVSMAVPAGALVPEQFNGLGVVPANGRLPKESIASIGNRPVYLIHAPNEVVLNIPADAHEVFCEIGLLPGAYTGAGNTDGVGYTFTVLHPDGTRKVIGQRYLDPRGKSEDRGPQYMRFPLPAGSAGIQLSIATDVGPHGDRSWDHSYVAGVTFR